MSVDDCHKQPVLLSSCSAADFLQYGFRPSEAFEQWALSNSKKVCDVISQRIAEGAKIIGTPTLTANPYMLERYGLQNKCAEYNKELSDIALEAVKASGKEVTAAGLVGPSEAIIEPFGDTSFTELISAYDKQIKALSDNVDMFIASDIDSVWDMRAAVISCKKAEKPVYVIVKTDEDGFTPQHQVSAKAALIMLQEMGADGFGVHCETAEKCAELLTELLPYSKIQTAAVFDAFESEKSVRRLAELGTDIIGSKSEKTEIIAESCKNNRVSAQVEKEDTSFIFTYDGQIYFLEPDTTEISKPISCLPDMEETIVHACKESVDILLVQINTADDAFDFARNAHMATIPVMFTSDNEIALRMALMLYQGRALIDSKTSISEEALDEMVKKYGAVIY